MTYYKKRRATLLDLAAAIIRETGRPASVDEDRGKVYFHDDDGNLCAVESAVEALDYLMGGRAPICQKLK